MTSTARERWHLIGAVTVISAPLVLGALLAIGALRESPLESAADTQPLIGAIESEERTDPGSVVVTLVAADTFAVTSQSTGIVTALDIAPGRAIAQGETAMRVAGAPVVAYVAVAPLYRDIGSSMRGDDVATAQRLLVDLGYLDKVDGDAGPATTLAIRRFNKDHGYGSANPTLGVGSLLWIPQGSSPPVTVSVRVGANLAPGEELYKATEGADAIAVQAQPAEYARTLTISNVSVALPAGATTVTSSADVAEVVAALAGQASTSATIERSVPRIVGTLPASALVTGVSGAVCYYSDTSSPGHIIPAIAGSVGKVDVDLALVGSPVLINPRAVRQDLTCGS